MEALTFWLILALVWTSGLDEKVERIIVALEKIAEKRDA